MRLGGGRLGVGELNEYIIFILCVFFLHNIERVHITYGYIFAYMRCLLFGGLSHNVFLRLSGARFCICLFITKDQVSLG